MPKSEEKVQANVLIKRNLKKAVTGILSTLIPKANPDFENKIEHSRNLDC